MVEPVELNDAFVEFFSPPRVAPEVKALGLKADLSVDKRPEGGGLDLSCSDDRAHSLHELKTRKPAVLGLSPPCTMYSALQRMWNLKKMKPRQRKKRWAEANCLLDFAMLCARHQHASGLKFFFEHPRRASSWDRSTVKRVSKLPGVQMVHFDQCCVGLKSPGGVPMKKATTFMTNSKAIADRFRDMKCTCLSCVSMQCSENTCANQCQYYCHCEYHQSSTAILLLILLLA